MRAVRYDRYGLPDVLRVADLAEPVPAAGQVCVRVEAASLNPLDWKLRQGMLRLLPGVKAPPRTTGSDFSGVIAATGSGAGPLRAGDRVFGSLSPLGREGSCAEMCIAEPRVLGTIPEGVGFETAACLPIAAGTAVQAPADDAKLSAGQHLLVVGAAGGVGHFAVQYAQHLGAQVTGLCGPDNLSFVADLGAHRVVDYGTDILALGASFDVVFDAASALDWRLSQRLLKPGGIYLSTAGTASAALFTGAGGLLAPLLGGTRARIVALRRSAAGLGRLGELAARGVLKPHIARRIGLDEVAQAQAAMAGGHGRGKIVVLPQGR